jgi:hypothetical protein
MSAQMSFEEWDKANPAQPQAPTTTTPPMSFEEWDKANPQQPKETSWGDVATGAATNLIPSVGNVIKGVAEMAVHPVDTVQGMGDVILGGVNNAMPASMQPDILTEQRKKAGALGDVYADRYGSVEGFKSTLANDPAAIMMDASMLLGGAGAAAKGGSIAAEAAAATAAKTAATNLGAVGNVAASAATGITKVAGGLGRVAEMANSAAVVTNPLYLPIKGTVATAKALPAIADFVKTPSNFIGANAEKIAEDFASRDKLFETPDSQSMGAAGVSKEMNRATMAEQLGFTGDKGLTAGQLSRDPVQQAFESDAAKIEGGMPLVERTVNQERHTHQKIDDFFEQTGAETGDLTSAGDVVSSHINNLAKQARAKSTAEYDKAAASPEGDKLVQLNDLASYINANSYDADLAPVLGAIKNKMLGNGWAEVDPVNPNGIIAKDMPLRDTESLRKTMAVATREIGNSNAHYGGEMKPLIDKVTEEAGGDLYKAARSAHRSYAETFKNTPIISDLISSKKGTNQRKVALEQVYGHIEKSPAASIEIVKNLLNGSGESGVQAWKEIQGRVIGEMSAEAKRIVAPNAAGESLVSVAGINKFVENLDKNGKLDLFFDTAQAEEIRGLGEITKTLMTHPTGAVNASNTGRVIANIAGMALDATISGALFGAPLPLVTGAKILRSQITGARARANVQAALNPKLPNGGVPPTPPTGGGTPPIPPTPTGGGTPPTGGTPSLPPPAKTLSLPTREDSLQQAFNDQHGDTIRFKSDGSTITRGEKYNRYIDNGKSPDEARTLVEADVINNKGSVTRATPTKRNETAIKLGQDLPAKPPSPIYKESSAKDPLILGNDGRVMQFANEAEATDFIAKNGLSGTHSADVAFGNNVVKLKENKNTLPSRDSIINAGVKSETPAPKTLPAKPKPPAINHEKDNILTAIRKLGGIDKGMYESTYGDTRGLKEQGINNVFKSAGGKSIDDLQSQLRSEGYLTPEGDAHELANLLYEPSVKEAFSSRKANYDHLKPVETEPQSLPAKPKKEAADVRIDNAWTQALSEKNRLKE